MIIVSSPLEGCACIFSMSASDPDSSYLWLYIEICTSVFAHSLSRVCLTVMPWTVACHASLWFTISQSLLKFISIKLVTLSNHLILCHPFLLLPSFVPSIRVFSNESILRIRWSKYWNFSFSISPSNEFQG